MPEITALSADPAPSAGERAYRYTKDLIIRGELSGGQLVSEGRICSDLDVSRTPVHEAFLRLDAEQLLELSSRKGAVVRPMAPHEARNVLEMREAIESAAAQRAVADGTLDSGRLSGLRSVLARQHVHLADRDVDGFVECDEEFHTAVVRASGNALALHFLALLRDRQQRLRHQLLGVRPEHLVTAYDDHLRLVERLEAGDATGYCEVLHAHVALLQGAL